MNNDDHKISYPLISIIVPVYNCENYLDKCINSILSQTYKHFELLLINDGSTDNSSIICDNYQQKDSRIQVFNKENGGVSSARNLGLRNANGEYVCFVDSDDWIDDNYLDAFFYKNKIEHDICIQGIKYFIPRRELEPIMFKYPKLSFNLNDNTDVLINEQLLENGCPVAKLFRMNIIKDYNIYFDEDISLNEDHLFVIDYYKYVNSIYLTDIISYHYYSDYQVPSLTKIRHSTTEFLLISKKISSSFRVFTKRFNKTTNYWKTYYPTLGLNQIINATIIANYEKDTFKKILECQKLWHLNKKTTLGYQPKSISTKLLIQGLNNKSPYLLYCYSFIISHWLFVTDKTKYFIKVLFNY